MSKTPTERPLAVYFLIIWMLLNVLLFLAMIPSDPQDLNNYIELVLWVPSIIGLWIMKKWGTALSVTVLGVTTGTSMYIVLEAYYLDMLNEAFASINGLRIVVNAVVMVYLFRSIFSGKFSE
ncbi:MAG: hypothetical protein CW716_07745 [Candidatus Bathyarchaeum sp.]|nr:MAG: hypothetical protein CW716_07745 [Candidatus Bathyarchaeum sp.]